MKLLEVNQVRAHFPVAATWWGRPTGWVKAVDGVSFRLDAGETLGVVGESGCGKTTLGRLVVGLVKPTSGTIRFEGEDLTALKGDRLARRDPIQMIFQDPYGSLNPRLTVEQSIGEALVLSRTARSTHERKRKTGELLELVGLKPVHAQRYPHEFSGGQRQRIGIARALAVGPRLLICDEPVSSLDVSVQAQVVNLLQDIQQERGLAYLFIAHDLAVVEHISHRILVMYLGKVMESGAARSVIQSPQHPYTRALISSVPSMDPALKPPAQRMAGDIPSPLHPPDGCPFHPRCPLAEERCRREVPVLRETKPGQWAACHLVE